MDLLVIPLGIVCLWGIRLNRKEFFEDYLSVKHTKALRGILVLLVVLGHLYKDADRGMLHLLFSNIGTLCVVVFFFLSGYGLQKRFAQSPGYEKTILTRRIPGILLPFLLLVPVYWGLYAWTGSPYTVGETLESLVTGDPIVRFGWYTLCQTLLYLVFFLAALAWGRRPGAMSLGVLAGTALLALVLYRAGMPLYWRYSLPAFPLGVFWAAEESRILPKLEKHWLLWVLVSFGGFALGFSGGLLTFRTGYFWIVACTLPVFVLLVLDKVRFDNPCLQAVGNLSFEIYSIHGFFMLLYRSDVCYIESDALWGAAVLASAIPAAWLLNRLLRKKG